MNRADCGKGGKEGDLSPTLGDLPTELFISLES